MTSSQKQIQEKIIEIQKKLSNLIETVQILTTQHKKSIADISCQISDFLIKLKQIQTNIEKNQINESHFKIQLDAYKESFNKLLQALNNRTSDNSDNIKQLRNSITKITSELYKIRTQLSENNGQTNQCFLGLDRVEKRLNALNPLNIEFQNTSAKEPLLLQKKIKGLILKIVLGIIIPVVLYLASFLFYQMYDKFIQKQYHKTHNQQTVQSKQ